MVDAEPDDESLDPKLDPADEPDVVDESLDDEPESDDPDEESVPDDPDDEEPRLSVLKNPLPLKVTPTGWKTFLTAMTSPESGWVSWVSESSVKDCWTSIVSPVSTNL